MKRRDPHPSESMADVYSAQLASLKRAEEAAADGDEGPMERPQLVTLEAAMPGGVKSHERLSWFSPTGTLVHLDVGAAHASVGELLEFSVPERLLKEAENHWQEFVLMAFDVPVSWTQDRGLATTLPSGVRVRISPPAGALAGDQLVFCVARWQLDDNGAGPKEGAAGEPTVIETRAVLNRLLVDAKRVVETAASAGDENTTVSPGPKLVTPGSATKSSTRSLSFRRMLSRKKDTS